jgi:hypothetical protein
VQLSFLWNWESLHDGRLRSAQVWPGLRSATSRNEPKDNHRPEGSPAQGVHLAILAVASDLVSLAQGRREQIERFWPVLDAASAAMPRMLMQLARAMLQGPHPHLCVESGIRTYELGPGAPGSLTLRRLRCFKLRPILTMMANNKP